MSARPWWCQDPTCSPIHNNAQPADEPGWGGFCCGRLSESCVEVVHGVEHANDGHLCIRSPRSGVTMLNVQAADWIMLGDMTVLALHAWGQGKCLTRLAQKARAAAPSPGTEP